MTVAAYPHEHADPDVLMPEEEDALLAGAPWRRFAVLGDSIAEGMGEPAEGYVDLPWGDRVANALRRAQPGLVYLNLGERDLRAAEVASKQLTAALRFEPDLAAVVCGGNDLLAEEFDPVPVVGEIERMVSSLANAGADIVLFTMFDITRAIDLPGRYGERVRSRLSALHAGMAELAAFHGAIFVDNAAHRRSADPTIYGSDLRHANRSGHAVVASLTIERLGRRLRPG